MGRVLQEEKRAAFFLAPCGLFVGATVCRVVYGIVSKIRPGSLTEGERGVERVLRCSDGSDRDGNAFLALAKCVGRALWVLAALLDAMRLEDMARVPSSA